MKLATMADAEHVLSSYLALAAQTLGKDVTIARTERLMAHIGNPERQLRVIHVAGTSGKTSTTYYIAALLRAAGSTVGHTVSPHVDSLCERVQLNGEPIPEPVFCAYMSEFLERVQTAPEQPTWFDCMIAFVYWVFAREHVDYAVIETGLGGWQDSTNVAARADKVCVITDIGYDHMAILGTTLGQIARHKAGIIHAGNVAFMYSQPMEVIQAVQAWVSTQQGSTLQVMTPSQIMDAYGLTAAPGMPAYQQRNWLLAYYVFRWVAQRDHITDINEAQLLATQTLQVPGRMQAVRVNGKLIIMDGAHNGQKMEAFFTSFHQLYQAPKPPVLLALKDDKDVHSIIPILKQYAGNITVTCFQAKLDYDAQSLDPEQVCQMLTNAGLVCRAIRNQDSAYQTFLDGVATVGLITGSFYFLHQIRSLHPELRVRV